MRVSAALDRDVGWVIALLLSVAVTALSAQVSLAEDADNLARQANTELRKAERLMHNSKLEASTRQLAAVEALLSRIEAADPKHPRLKILRGKCNKLRKDLERRQPKQNTNPGTADDGGKKPDDAQLAKLPRAARLEMERFDRAKRIIEHAYRWINKSKTTELSKSVEAYYEDIEARFKDLESALEEATKHAAKEGLKSHPILVEARKYLEAAPGRLATVQAEMNAFNLEKAAAEKRAGQRAANENKKSATSNDADQAAQDWKELAALAKEYQDSFQSQSDFKKGGAKVAAAWKDWKTRFVPVRKRFRERYGARNPEIYTRFEKVPKPKGVTMPATQAAGIAYGIDLEQCEQSFADWSAGWAKSALRLSKSIKHDNREKLELKYARAEDAVRYFKLAKLWKPESEFGEQIQEAEAAAEEALPLWKAVLKELKWPGHNASFAGPGKPDDLAGAALQYLRDHPDWSAPEYDDEHIPIAACVEGKAWNIWKRAPLTKEPTQYSVAILVAFKGKADPELVYVYHMVFYTAEAAGVEPGLPFHYANSKQYARFRMLKENVPQ